MKRKIFPLLVTIILLLSSCNNIVDETIYEDDSTRVQTVTSDDGLYKSMYPGNLAQFRLPQSGDTVVNLKTNHGDIHLLMFPEAAPKAVENFITHAQNGYYDGIIFHRVIKDFMIQGGDPTGTGREGESIWGDPFEDEFNDSYFPYRGTLAMANSGPATNGSQFFIVQNNIPDNSWSDAMVDYGMDKEMADAYSALGGTPHLFNRHTVFGQVVAGMEVVDAIAAVSTGTADKPQEDVIIQSTEVTVIQ